MDFKLADKNVIRQWGHFIDGMVQGFSFRPSKMYKPTKQAFWCTRNLHGNVWNSRCLDCSELHNLLLYSSWRRKNEKFARGTKMQDSWHSTTKEIENLDDQGCLKSRDPVDPKSYGKMWIWSKLSIKHTSLCRASGKNAWYQLDNAALEVLIFVFWNEFSVFSELSCWNWFSFFSEIQYWVYEFLS